MKRTQAEFRKLVRECIHLAEEKYEVDFGRVGIFFDIRTETAGEARTTTHETKGRVYSLRFNKNAIHKEWDNMVKSTIPHEVAHLVQWARPDFKSDGHDYKWRAIAISLGDIERGKKYHNMELSK